MFDETIFQIFEYLNEGVVIINRDGKVVYINRFAAEMDNVDRTIAKGRYLLDVYPSLNEKSSTLLKVLKNKEAIINKVQNYRNYKGENVFTESSSYPLFKGKKFIGVVGISRFLEEQETYHKDITDIAYSKINAVSVEGKVKGSAKYDFIDIVGKSSEILKAKEKASKAAKTSSPVLIYGETGTGKELFVHAIHNNSIRKDRPFVAQNCAAIPANLLEGILFGTVRGSFTGSENRKGLFELADGGTLYLDELNSMPIDLQAKLLRVLQEGTIRRLGDAESKEVDIRIIASLNEEPEKAVQKGELRKDLLYRLNVVRIDLPPLRKRKEDIPILIKNFIQKFNIEFKADIDGIEESVLERFITMEWEGNIRELEHSIERIFNMKRFGVIKLKDIEDIGIYSRVVDDEREMTSLREKLQEIEESYIKEAMAITNNNVSKAAVLLDLPRQTLQNKLKKLQRADGK